MEKSKTIHHRLTWFGVRDDSTLSHSREAWVLGENLGLSKQDLHYLLLRKHYRKKRFGVLYIPFLSFWYHSYIFLVLSTLFCFLIVTVEVR